MPVGAGAASASSAGADRCRPVPIGAGAADRPQETLYQLNLPSVLFCIFIKLMLAHLFIYPSRTRFW